MPSSPSVPTVTREPDLDFVRPTFRLRRKLRRTAVRSAYPCVVLETRDDVVQCRTGVGTRRAGLAGADARRARLLTGPKTDCCLLRELAGPRLQSVDDGIDLFPGRTNLFLEPRVQPLAERFLTVAHGGFARTKLPLGLRDGEPFRGRLLALPFECPQVIVHTGQMLGELLLALGEVLARGRDDIRRHPQPRGDLDRQASAW